MKRILVLALLLAGLASGAEYTLDLRGGSALCSAAAGTAAAETVTAAAKGDSLRFETAQGLWEGKVQLAYRDINGVEVRAGELGDQDGIYVLTVLDGQLSGRVENRQEQRCIKLECQEEGPALSCCDQPLEETYRDWLPGGDSLVPPEGATTSGVSLEDGLALSSIDWDTDDTIYIRVCTFYTPAALKKLGSHNKMKSDIAKGIATGNLCLLNSQTRAQLQLVHCQQWNYVEQGSAYPDLSNFVGGYDGFEGVKAMRNLVGGDLCAMVGREDDVGGLAYVNGSATGMESMSYHFIRDVQMTGDSWVHEMGHNIGCNHAYEQESSPGPASGGVFGHSLGYYFIGAQDRGKYATTMAYSQNGYDRCYYFSSPNYSYKGTVCGTETRNNALTWTKIRPIASVYRSLPAEGQGEWCYEGFDYPAGKPLDARNGGTGWGSGWNAGVDTKSLVTDRGLEYFDGEKWLMTLPGSFSGDPDYSYRSRRLYLGNSEGFSYASIGSTGVWASILMEPQNLTGRGCYVTFMGTTFGLFGDCWSCNNLDSDLAAQEGRAELVLARINLQSDGYTTTRLWVNPKLDTAPDLETADIVSTQRVYSRSFYDVSLNFQESACLVDELRIGLSAESVLPSRAPYLSASCGLTNGTIRVTWPGSTTAKRVLIYRSEDGSPESAVQVWEQEGGTEWTDTGVEEGRIYSYFARGFYEAESGERESRLAGPARGFAGKLALTACPNGPYVVSKGQDALLTAAGSAGSLLTYAWGSGKVQSDFSPTFRDFAWTNNFTPGEYEITLTVQDMRFPDAPPVSAATTLTVLDTAPEASFDKVAYATSCGVPCSFHVTVGNTVPGDQFEYRWRPEATAEFTDWSGDSYYRHTYQTPETQQEITCEVRNKTGLTGECKALVNVGKREAVMSLAPAALDLAGLSHAQWKVENRGAEPYVVTPVCTAAGVSIYPASATVSNGVAVFRVQLDRPGLAGGQFDIDCGFASLHATISDWQDVCQPSANGPYEAYQGDVCLVSCRPAGSCLYRWLLDDNPLGSPSKGLALCPLKADCDPGEHSLKVQYFTEDLSLCGEAETALTVKAREPALLFRVLSREEGKVLLRTFGEGYGSVWSRTPSDPAGWREDGLAVLNLEPDNYYRLKFEVTDQGGLTNLVPLNADLREEVPFLIPEIVIAGAAPEEAELVCGEVLQLGARIRGGYAGAVSYLWQEWGGNPTRGALLEHEGESVSTAPLQPGVHYFTLYAVTDGYPSLPCTVKVNVTGLQGLVCQVVGDRVFPLEGATLAQKGKVFATDERGRFLIPETGEAVLSRTGSRNATLRTVCPGWCETLVMDEPLQLISGLCQTNLVWGGGPLAGCYAGLVDGPRILECSCDGLGLFSFLSPAGLQEGEMTLGASLPGLGFPALRIPRKDCCNLVQEPDNFGNGSSYLYLTVYDGLSGFPLEGASADFQGKTVKSAAKGNCSVLSGARGFCTVQVGRAGYLPLVTNLTLAGSTSMRNVQLQPEWGRCPDYLDWMILDTDGALVQPVSLRLVSGLTSSVVLKDESALPLQTYFLNAGHKTTLRLQKSRLDSYALTFVPQHANVLRSEMVPEPALLALALFLGLLNLRRKA